MKKMSGRKEQAAAASTSNSSNRWIKCSFAVTSSHKHSCVCTHKHVYVYMTSSTSTAVCVHTCMCIVYTHKQQWATSQYHMYTSYTIPHKQHKHSCVCTQKHVYTSNSGLHHDITQAAQAQLHTQAYTTRA